MPSQTVTRRRFVQSIGFTVGGVSAGCFGTDSERTGDDIADAEPDTPTPEPVDDIISASAATLADQIRTEAVTASEVVDAFLERIEERDDELNSFITVAAEQARETAAAADQAVTNGDELGPLHGVPFAVKDLDPVEGMRYTNGTVIYEDRIADRTALHVQRLRDAGAIVIGKTNTPEYGWIAKTDNELIGPTANPFDLEYNAGGSSGGSTAAVADGLVPIATGSDGAGSVRVPAAFTNTVGVKPTFRRIPNPGRFASGLTFFHYGPQTRTVEDAALLLSVMAGPDPGDPHVLPDDGIDYLGALDRDVDGLSVGYSPGLGLFPIDDQVQTVVDDAVEAFREAGATVEEVEVPVTASYDEVMEVLLRDVHVVYGTVVQGFLDAGWEEQQIREQFPDELVERGMDGREIDAVTARRDNSVRSTVYEGVQSVVDEVDVLVTATTAVPPFRNDILGPTEINEVEIDPLFGWVIAAIFNMTGHPAASVPAGITEGGLPVGMQIVGDRFDDDTVLAVSAAYERVNPWHDAYPAF